MYIKYFNVGASSQAREWSKLELTHKAALHRIDSSTPVWNKRNGLTDEENSSFLTDSFGPYLWRGIK